MTERHTYQPGVPCWVDTGQPEPRAAVDFYGALFGWEFTEPGPMPGDPPGHYFVARLGGRDVAGVGSRPEGAPPAPVWNTFIRVESADDSAKKVSSAGGGIVMQPFDVRPAGRMAVVTDPQGAHFVVWEPQQREGAQLVNQSGTWAMSILSVRDPEDAQSFYGAVFGWETDTFGTGEGKVTLWRLPGYVGGEPEQPVPRDVVAVMVPTNGDVPSNWSANFWVDDVDATAAKA
ncbi:MAG: VOC family protein, partial [Actinomycetota bacterium]